MRRDRCGDARCGCYTLRLLLLLDADETAVVDDNGWWRHEVFLSQHMLDLLEDRQRIAATPITPVDPDLPFAETLFKAGPFDQLLLKGARLLVNSVKLSRAHRLLLCDLVDGVEVSGSLDEISLTEALIMKSLEVIDARIRRARAHDGGGILLPIGRSEAPPPPPEPPRLRRLT